MTTYLITGGAGFIGVNFIYYMLETHPEDRIVCLDRLTYAGNLNSLCRAMGCPNFEFVRGDIADQQTIDPLFQRVKPDYVVNFAAESHVDRSIEDPGIFLRTNILGTQILMDACLKYNVKRFHQVSTDEVYGDLPLDQPEWRFTEESPIRPSSPYSASKASADLLVQSYIRTFALPATISRCSNNYGPYQFPEKLIPVVIYKALREEAIPVYGKGENVRDWLYVKDHCVAIDSILHAGEGSVYNIGGNNEKSNLDLVKWILQILCKDEGLITFVTDRPGHDRRYAIDAGKMEEELRWRPQIPFEQGLEETVGWYLQHEEWLNRILSGEYQRDNREISEKGVKLRHR